MKSTRRNFIRSGVALAGALTGLSLPEGSRAQTAPDDIEANPAATLPAAPPVVRRGDIPYRKLGRTGEEVSIVGLGGYHVGVPQTDAEAVRLVQAALDHGINFLDNCWSYHNGNSEVRMGKALGQGGYRNKAFLMTKIDGRTAKRAGEQIDDCLRRLQTHHLDLLQFHEIIRMDVPDRIFAPGGALEAALAAKKAGKIRYIGFTGHKAPRIHRHMLALADQHGFRFDTVQMPVNVLDAHFRSFTHHVMPVALEKQMGVLAMKTFGGSVILNRLDGKNVATTIEMLHYSMSLPVSTVITGCDRQEILDQALSAARTFKPMTHQEIAALLARTRPYALDGSAEFKTSTAFDSTPYNPSWTG